MRDVKTIECDVTVPAPIADVWQAWTTAEGLISFFAPAANIETKPGGAYEILFNPEAAEGNRGAEGMRFLALQEPVFLSFTWNAPPHLPEVRGQRTHVEVRLEERGANQTRVRLSHGGWGTGGQWEEAFAYFSRAWEKVVLPRLVHRFAQGPVDWSNPPAFE